MTGAFTNRANPNGVDLGRVGPSRAGMLMDASFSRRFHLRLLMVSRFAGRNPKHRIDWRRLLH